MSDRVSASITIGGKLPADLLGQFARIVQREGLSTDWDGPPFEPSDIADGQPLELMAHQAPWGIFRELEAFCSRHRLPYKRRTASCPGQWGPALALFNGVGVAESYDLDEAGAVVVSHEVVDRLGILEAVLAHFGKADFTVPPLVVVSGEKEANNG